MNFTKVLSRSCPQADLEILASWEVAYNEVAQIAAADEVPAANVLLGGDEAYAYSFPQAWHLYNFKYFGECEFVARNIPGRAGMQVLLLRKRGKK